MINTSFSIQLSRLEQLVKVARLALDGDPMITVIVSEKEIKIMNEGQEAMQFIASWLRMTSDPVSG